MKQTKDTHPHCQIQMFLLYLAFVFKVSTPFLKFSVSSLLFYAFLSFTFSIQFLHSSWALLPLSESQMLLFSQVISSANFCPCILSVEYSYPSSQPQFHVLTGINRLAAGKRYLPVHSSLTFSCTSHILLYISLRVLQ